MSEIAILDQNKLTISEQINTQILSVLSDPDGFQKSFVMAKAISTMKELLTPEVMKDIMALQGSRLGFRTDKDKDGGYSFVTVQNCCIEALLYGFELVGNQFNIIGGNMYPTREGFTFQLDKMKGLTYDIEYPNITQTPDKLFGSVTALIRWEYNGVKDEKQIVFPVNSNKYATIDALKGKGERKAKCWLFNKLKNTKLSDGDADDAIIDITPKVSARKQNENDDFKRKLDALPNFKTLEELSKYKNYYANDPELQQAYNDRFIELQQSM